MILTKFFFFFFYLFFLFKFILIIFFFFFFNAVLVSPLHMHEKTGEYVLVVEHMNQIKYAFISLGPEEKARCMNGYYIF